ncbi:MAG: NUDIX domain-containing protein [Candidatus Paceibacterota bacterium]
MKKATLVHFINKETNEVLLADQQFKIVGLKGFGGKIEEGESALASTTREVTEETGGITFDEKDLIPVGLIDFYNGPEEDKVFGDPSFRVLFYNCYLFKGEAVSTAEMQDPQFYEIDNLPIERLIPGDDLFIHEILKGNPTKGWIRRTADFAMVINAEIYPCTLAELVI